MRAAASILRGLPGHRKAAPQLLPEAVLQEWLGEGADMRSVLGVRDWIRSRVENFLGFYSPLPPPSFYFQNI